MKKYKADILNVSIDKYEIVDNDGFRVTYYDNSYNPPILVGQRRMSEFHSFEDTFEKAKEVIVDFYCEEYDRLTEQLEHMNNKLKKAESL